MAKRAESESKSRDYRSAPDFMDKLAPPTIPAVKEWRFDRTTLEGKVWNNAIRFGKHHMLPTLLRNMADYLEQDNYPWIHPSERPVAPKIYKRKYNELKRKMNEQEDIDPPPFPKRKKKMSTRLLSCFKKYDIDPYTPTTTSKATKLNEHEDSNHEPDVSVSCPGIEPDVDSTD